MLSLFRAYLLFILTVISCSGCAANPYQEPPSTSQNTAILKTDNESLVQGFLSAMILKPRNNISIVSLDGKVVESFSNEIRVTSGNHHFIVICTLNGLENGTKEFNFIAQPGRIYTVAYPSYMNMHGYTVDFTACQKVILR